jgi:RNA polymerase sigma factor (sigma-70 family)
MPVGPERVIHHLRRLVSRGAAEPAGDAVLLERFVRRRDEDAFAALVARHGRMVLATCRRVLRDAHRADDAFQATWLVLARKAGSLRRPEALAAWLYGTARRLALRCRRDDARAQQWATGSRLGAPAPRCVDPLAEITARELLFALDEEVQRLPEVYRLPVLLCSLEGRTQEEAAHILGWAAGSVKGRLERGRKRLHARLARRGLTLSAALACLEAAHGVFLGLPPATAAGLARAALAFAAGDPAAAGIAAPVAALVNEGLRSLSSAKLAAGIVLVLAVALAVGSVMMMAQGPPPQPERGPRPVVKPQERKDPVAVQPARTDRFGDPLPDKAIARLGTVRFRPGFSSLALAISPDGKTLASGNARGRGVGLWDTATGRPLHLLRGDAQSVAFAPDGKQLFTAGYVRAIDVAAGKELRRFGANFYALKVALSPDGRVLAAAGDGNVLLIEAATFKQLRQLPVQGGTIYSNLAFSPDGQMLAAGSTGKGVRVWDLSGGAGPRYLKGHRGEVWCVAFAPRGKLLASASEDKTVRLWDPDTGKELRQLKGHIGWANALAFAPDGKTLASGGADRTIRLWDPATGKELRRWQAHAVGVNAFCFSRDGKVLATTAHWDHAIRLWDPLTGKGLQPTAGHTGLVDWVRFTPDGKALLSAGRDGKVLWWDLRRGTGQEVFGRRSWPPDGPLVWSAKALSPDGRVLARARWYSDTDWKVPDPIIRLWDKRAEKQPRLLRGHRGTVRSLQFSPDGRLLVSAGEDKTIRFWNPRTGNEVRRFERPAPVRAVAFAPDGQTLASAEGKDPGDSDGQIRLLDPGTGKELRHWAGWSLLGGLVYSPDSRWLAVIDQGLQVWDPATGVKVREFQGDRLGLAFSPDSRLLAAGELFHQTGTEGDPGLPKVSSRIHVWELASGQEIRQFDAPQNWVWSLGFAPDGRTLASGGGDSTIVLWDLTDRRQGARLRPARLSAAEMDRLWTDLGKEAAKAHRALWTLVAAPRQAVLFLRERLHPVAADPRQVARLIADLESNRYAVRRRATRELERLGELAWPALEKARQAKSSLEMCRRLDQLVQRLATRVPGPDQLRALRAVTVLEQAGTAEAGRLLQVLATGVPEARLTHEAKASLKRLTRRADCARR